MDFREIINGWGECDNIKRIKLPKNNVLLSQVKKPSKIGFSDKIYTTPIGYITVTTNTFGLISTNRSGKLLKLGRVDSLYLLKEEIEINWGIGSIPCTNKDELISSWGLYGVSTIRVNEPDNLIASIGLDKKILIINLANKWSRDWDSIVRKMYSSKNINKSETLHTIEILREELNQITLYEYGVIATSVIVQGTK